MSGGSGNRSMWRRVAGAVLSVATLASLAVGTAGVANAAESQPSDGARAGARISVSRPSGPVYAGLVTTNWTRNGNELIYTPTADGMVPYVDVTVNGVQPGVEYCVAMEHSNDNQSFSLWESELTKRDCVKASGSSMTFRKYYDEYTDVDYKDGDGYVKNDQIRAYPTVVRKSDFVDGKIGDAAKIVAQDSAGVAFNVVNLKNLIHMSNLRVSNVGSTTADLTYDYKLDASLRGQVASTCLETRLWRTYDIDFPNGFDGLDTNRDFFSGRAGDAYDDYMCGTGSSVTDDKVDPDILKIKTYEYKKDGKVRYTYRYQGWTRTWSGDFATAMGGKLSGTVVSTLPWLNPNTKYGNWNRGDDCVTVSGGGDPIEICYGKYSDGELSTLEIAAAQYAKKQAHSTDPVGLLVSGLQVKFKDGSYYTPFSEMNGGTEVPEFTTKAADASKPSQPSTPSSGSFADVTASTPHADDVTWLASSGISTGWKRADGKSEFRPALSVTRQDMAAFLYRLAGSPKFDETKVRNPFVDVNASTPHYKEILWLASTGVSAGWRTARGVEFRGMDTVKRQDMAAFLHRLADYRKAEPSLGKAVSFRDVSARTPHADDVAWLARTGVTTGWRDGTFRGMNEVVRQDMAAFLHRMSANVLK